MNKEFWGNHLYLFKISLTIDIFHMGTISFWRINVAWVHLLPIWNYAGTWSQWAGTNSQSAHFFLKNNLSVAIPHFSSAIASAFRPWGRFAWGNLVARWSRRKQNKTSLYTSHEIKLTDTIPLSILTLEDKKTKPEATTLTTRPPASNPPDSVPSCSGRVRIFSSCGM